MIIKFHEAGVMLTEPQLSQAEKPKKLFIANGLNDDQSQLLEADVIVYDYAYYDDLVKLPEGIKQKIFLSHSPDCKITSDDLTMAIERHKFRGFVTAVAEIRL